MNTFLWSEHHPVSIIVIIWTHFCEVNIIPSPLLLLYEHISVKWTISRLHYYNYINTFLWSEHPVSIIIIILTHFCEVNIIPSPLLLLYEHISVKWTSRLHYCYYMNTFLWSEYYPVSIIVIIWTHFCEVNIIPSPLFLLYKHISVIIGIIFINTFLWSEHPVSIIGIIFINTFLWSEHPVSIIGIIFINTFLWSEHPVSIIGIIFINTFLWSEHYPVSIIVIIWTHFCEVNIPSPLLLLYEHISVKWTSRLHYWYYIY